MLFPAQLYSLVVKEVVDGKVVVVVVVVVVGTLSVVVVEVLVTESAKWNT